MITKHEAVMYALYRGDNLLTIGTVSELADFLDVKESTIKWYSYPTKRKRLKPNSKGIYAVRLED